MGELELLAHADARGRRYTEANGHRRVFPLVEAIAALTAFDEPRPESTPCRHPGRRDGNGRSQKFNGHSLMRVRLSNGHIPLGGIGLQPDGLPSTAI